MRRLVLIAACVASLATGCIISSDPTPVDQPAFITADWSFHTAANTALTCPTGFGTAAVTATPVGGGTPIIDLYDCAALTGRADYPADQYDVDIDITSQGGSQVYGSSLTDRVDITTVDATVTEDFIDDGGRMLFDWVLVDAGNAPINCAAAGAAKVSILNTVSGGTASVEDTFPCADATGVTAPILAGTYTASLSALNTAGQALGAPTNKTNVVVADRNGYTDLGSVTIVAQ